MFLSLSQRINAVNNIKFKTWLIKIKLNNNNNLKTVKILYFRLKRDESDNASNGKKIYL